MRDIARNTDEKGKKSNFPIMKEKKKWPLGAFPLKQKFPEKNLLLPVQNILESNTLK